jgi:hypothetical protein
MEVCRINQNNSLQEISEAKKIKFMRTREEIMHKRSLVVFVLTTLVSIFLTGFVSENRMTPKPPDPLLPSKAVFVNHETGKRIELPVVKNSVKALGQNKYEAQYSVKIPEVTLSAGHYVPYPGYDPTYSAEIVIWVKYFLSYIKGVPYLKVYHYDGQWIRLDHRVRCTKLTVATRVFGELLSTGRRVSGSSSFTTYKPVIGAKYRNLPRYYGEFIQINDGYYQGGITTVTLKRGTSTWTGSVSVLNPGRP